MGSSDTCPGTLQGMAARFIVQWSNGKVLHRWSVLAYFHQSVIQRRNVGCAAGLCKAEQGAPVDSSAKELWYQLTVKT